MSDASAAASTDPVDEVRGAFGLASWGADVGHGSFLTLELGRERMLNGATRGEFHLMLYLAAWRIERPDEVLVSSEDDDLASRVGVLDGRTLREVTFSMPSMSTIFRFDDGVTLTTFSVYTDDGEHWMLYRPDGTVFTAGPGPRWSVEAGSPEASPEPAPA